MAIETLSDRSRLRFVLRIRPLLQPQLRTRLRGVVGRAACLACGSRKREACFGNVPSETCCFLRCCQWRPEFPSEALASAAPGFSMGVSFAGTLMGSRLSFRLLDAAVLGGAPDLDSWSELAASGPNGQELRPARCARPMSGRIIIGG